MKPIRVQRKRTKGFKLPENTICVTRGTKLGNPFKVIKDESGLYRIFATTLNLQMFANTKKADFYSDKETAIKNVLIYLTC